MLSRDEMLDLLSYVQSYDTREVSAPTVASWLDASLRGRWTFDEAVEAVKDHYARTTAFLMPGHITEAIRSRRQQPAPLPEQRRALEESRPAPATPETVAAVMAQVSRQFGWDDQIERRSVLAVACPVEHCRAKPGEQCTRPSKRAEAQRAAGRVTVRPHPSRRDAAAEHEMTKEATS